jgi:hypothetical protein
MGTPRVMKLVNGYTGEMVCRVCGSVHRSDLKTGGQGTYRYGCWQCVYHCKLPKQGKSGRAFDGWRDRWIDPSEMFFPKH